MYSALFFLFLSNILYQTQRTVFHLISKYQEVGWKKNAEPRAFLNQLQGVWKSDQTLFQVFDSNLNSFSLTITNYWWNSKQTFIN